MNQFLISAARKSSGKTLVSVGLAAAYHMRGTNIATFKKGPDYIDPIWLSAASNKPCWNLDFYTMSRDEITEIFGSQISELVQGLTKISKFALKINKQKLGENYRKLILASSKEMASKFPCTYLNISSFLE